MNEQARIKARADALDELQKAGYACRPHPMWIDCVIVADPVRSSVHGLVFEDRTVSALDVSRFINARS